MQNIVKSSVTLLSPVEFLEDSPQRSFIMDVLIDALSERRNQLETLNRLSLYPSEELLWDQYQVPLENSYSADFPLALPKLNLQFLTIHDYLLRNFILFRLESAFEIREDLIDAIKRMSPKAGAKGTTLFGGWARMALPIVHATIDEVYIYMYVYEKI
jgi:intron-binding protein aquarius